MSGGGRVRGHQQRLCGVVDDGYTGKAEKEKRQGQGQETKSNTKGQNRVKAR